MTQQRDLMVARVYPVTVRWKGETIPYTLDVGVLLTEWNDGMLDTILDASTLYWFDSVDEVKVGQVDEFEILSVDGTGEVKSEWYTRLGEENL